MRVCVVGAGAMGSLCGAMFQDAGNDVSFLDVNPATVAAITSEGFTITRSDGRSDRYHPAISQDAAALGGPMDLVLFQVKGFATEAAASGARPLVGPDTSILTLQNGLGNVERLRVAFPDNPLLVGISLHSATMVEPGRYAHTGVRSTVIGPTSEAWYAQAEAAAEALDGSGYPVELEHETDVWLAVYAKWVLNCGSLPTLAITGLPTAEIDGREPVLAVCDALTREACSLAGRAGIALDADERVAYNRGLFKTAGGKASMLQDLEAGRRTEIDTINGAAVALAERYGEPAPLNRAIVGLIKGREAALGIT
jgi:2-dehydropantoate 2-reductase